MKLKQNLRKLAEDRGIDGKEQSDHLCVSQVGGINQTSEMWIFSLKYGNHMVIIW
jgi:hypothetical protein